MSRVAPSINMDFDEGITKNTAWNNYRKITANILDKFYLIPYNCLYDTHSILVEHFQ